MDVRQAEVTRWYLEQREPGELRPAAEPAEPVDVVRAELPSPEYGRFLYSAVGADWYWIDRLPWSRERWASWLDRPGCELWVAYVRGTPAGYAELDAQPDGQVEIAYFGLLPGFLGRGLGGHLLTVATRRAWDLAARRPGPEPTRRVWLNTCSLDGPVAMDNYRARGFKVYDTVREVESLPVPPPRAWPTAGAAAGPGGAGGAGE